MALAAIIAFVPGARPAFACAKVSFVNLDRGSTLVHGQVASWRETGTEGANGGRTIELTIRVDGVYRGESTKTILLPDAASYTTANGQPEWRGDTEACAGLDADPTGKTVILSLVPAPADVRTLSSPGILYIGNGTDGATSEDATFAEVDAFLRDIAGEPKDPGRSRIWLQPVLTVVGVALLVAVGTFARSYILSRRKTESQKAGFVFKRD